MRAQCPIGIASAFETLSIGGEPPTPVARPALLPNRASTLVSSSSSTPPSADECSATAVLAFDSIADESSSKRACTSASTDVAHAIATSYMAQACSAIAATAVAALPSELGFGLGLGVGLG